MLRAVSALTISISIAILGVVFTPFGASAQSQCDTRANVISVLQGKYKESQAAVGVTMNGALLEVWTTEDGATWSILVSNPGGQTCLVAAGEGWQSVPLAALQGPRT